MWSAWPSNRLTELWVLLCLGALVGAGCDGGASKRDSYYQRLVGTWTAERLEVGGNPVTPRLDERYTALRFNFRSEEGRRTYRMISIRDEDTTRLAQGRIEMLSAETLQMMPGGEFEAPVFWTLSFDGSWAILEMPENRRAGSGDFLRAILPGRSWGETQLVRLELAPVE